MISEEAAFVWEILSKKPIAVLDDDTKSIWSNERWELVTPRNNNRVIGSANIISAFNQLRTKNISENKKLTLATFKSILLELKENNLIRHNPESIRKTFKIV